MVLNEDYFDDIEVDDEDINVDSVDTLPQEQEDLKTLNAQLLFKS